MFVGSCKICFQGKVADFLWRILAGSHVTQKLCGKGCFRKLTWKFLLTSFVRLSSCYVCYNLGIGIQLNRISRRHYYIRFVTFCLEGVELGYRAELYIKTSQTKVRRGCICKNGIKGCFVIVTVTFLVSLLWGLFWASTRSRRFNTFRHLEPDERA